LVANSIFSLASQEEVLKEQALELCNRALSFDFIGTAPDESFEDLGTVQLPAAWRQIIEEPGTLGLFFDLYNNNPANVSHRAMVNSNLIHTSISLSLPYLLFSNASYN
jgi:hypothetical protein